MLNTYMYVCVYSDNITTGTIVVLGQGSIYFDIIA